MLPLLCHLLLIATTLSLFIFSLVIFALPICVHLPSQPTILVSPISYRSQPIYPRVFIYLERGPLFPPYSHILYGYSIALHRGFHFIFLTHFAVSCPGKWFAIR